MKLFDFDKRHLYFVVIFFVVLVVDFIFFVGLKVPEFLPGEFLTGVIFMIGFFVIIPIAVAYQISFKLSKNSSKELEIKKINKKIVIVISVLLALFVFLIIPKGPVKFEPYTFYPVTDQEFKKPLKMIVTRKIGENEYYLKETEAGGVSLYQADKFIFDLPALIDSKSASDFWYDNSTNTVLIVAVKSTTPRNRYEQIFKYSLNTNKQEPLQVLKTTLLGIYSGADQILDYFSDTGILLIKSGDGDACGGSGKIWLLRKLESQTIQDYGNGCFSKELPRFVGYDGRFLYFALFDQSQQGSYEAEGVLKEIYKIAPQTKIKITIDNPKLSDNIAQIKLSNDNQNLIITTDKGKNIFLNLELNSINKEASPSAGK